MANLLKCICIKENRELRPHFSKRKHLLFNKGEKKIIKDLDCVTYLKTMRLVRVLASVLLTQNQKLLVRFSKQNMLESDSSGSDSDANEQDPVKLQNSTNYFLKSIAKERIKNAV